MCTARDPVLEKLWGNGLTSADCMTFYSTREKYHYRNAVFEVIQINENKFISYIYNNFRNLKSSEIFFSFTKFLEIF